MLAQDIINRVRLTPLDDNGASPLWADAELTIFMNEVIDELCEKTFILYDSSSLDLCRWYVGIKAAWLGQGTNAATLKVLQSVDYYNTVLGGSPKKWTLVIQDNIAMTTCATQAVSTFCQYLISVDASQTITVTKGINATTVTAAILPDLPVETTPIGMLLIATDASHTFTSGTTSLNSTGITATFQSSAAIFSTDSRVVRLNRVKMDQHFDPLDIKDIFWMDGYRPNWEWYAPDVPYILVKRRDKGQYQLFPPPLYPDRIVLTVARRPLVPLDATKLDVMTPEIDDAYIKRIYNGIAWKAYQKHDSDAFDGKASDVYRALWLNDIEEVKQEVMRNEQRNDSNELPYGVL